MTANQNQNKAAQLQRLRQRHSDRSGKRSRSVSSAPSASFVTQRPTKTAYRHAFNQQFAFFFLMAGLLVVWVAYRALFHMPIWFDEAIAKAIVFGVPTLWLASRSRFIAQNLGLDPAKMVVGLNLGTAIGGLYGFAAILTQVVAGRPMVAGAFFATDTFLYMATWALFTAWWESLFFFGLPVQYLRSIASWISDWWIGGIVTVLFLLFHAPLRFLLTGASPAFFTQMGILTIFVIGQFVVYTRTRNLYALILSHFFWGLVVEVYSQTLMY